MLNKILKKDKTLNQIGIRRFINDYFKFKNLVIPAKELIELHHRGYLNKKKSVLFGKEIHITDSFWYLHSLNELFIEEVYTFKSDKADPLIIDCGSNIGLSIIYFKRLFPQSHIIGFEPDNEIFQNLEHNISSFNLSDIEIHQKAVWINEIPLKFMKDGSLGGHLTDSTTENTIEIQTFRLKNLLTDKKIDFLKIDIEGAEYEVIKDCKDVLVNVEKIFIEYHSILYNPQMIGELLMILKEAGFKIYIKEAWENMKNPFIERKNTYFDLQLNIFGYRT